LISVILNQLHAIADPVWGAKFDFAMNNPADKHWLTRASDEAGRRHLDSILARVSTGEYVSTRQQPLESGAVGGHQPEQRGRWAGRQAVHRHVQRSRSG
jgi:hypothetical protein